MCLFAPEKLLVCKWDIDIPYPSLDLKHLERLMPRMAPAPALPRFLQWSSALWPWWKRCNHRLEHTLAPVQICHVNECREYDIIVFTIHYIRYFNIPHWALLTPPNEFLWWGPLNPWRWLHQWIWERGFGTAMAQQKDKKSSCWWGVLKQKPINLFSRKSNQAPKPIQYIHKIFFHNRRICAILFFGGRWWRST